MGSCDYTQVEKSLASETSFDVRTCAREQERGVVLLYDLSSGPDKCLEDPFV